MPWKALSAAGLDWLFDGYERHVPTLTLPELIAAFFLQPGEERAIGSFLVASLTFGGSSSAYAVRWSIPWKMEREADLFGWVSAPGVA